MRGETIAVETPRYATVRAAARALRWMALATMAGLLAYLAWVCLAAGRVLVTNSWGAIGRLDPGLDSFDYAHPWTMPLVEGPSVGLLFYGLWRLVRLTRLYEHGRLFDAAAARHLRVFSWCLFLSQLAEFGAEALLRLGMWLTIPHIGPVPLRFSTVALWAMLLSFLVLLLSRILSEAQLIAADNEQIV
jgi:hypothetical protein